MSAGAAGKLVLAAKANPPSQHNAWSTLFVRWRRFGWIGRKYASEDEVERSRSYRTEHSGLGKELKVIDPSGKRWDTIINFQLAARPKN